MWWRGVCFSLVIDKPGVPQVIPLKAKLVESTIDHITCYDSRVFDRLFVNGERAALIKEDAEQALALLSPEVTVEDRHTIQD